MGEEVDREVIAVASVRQAHVECNSSPTYLSVKGNWRKDFINV